MNELKNEPKTFWMVIDGGYSIYKYRTQQQAIKSLEDELDPEDCEVYEVLGEYKVKSQEVKIQLKTRSEIDFD